MTVQALEILTSARATEGTPLLSAEQTDTSSWRGQVTRRSVFLTLCGILFVLSLYQYMPYEQVYYRVDPGTNGFSMSAKNDGVTFVVVGDWGRKGKHHQQPVADAMGYVCAKRGCDFVVSTGDNFYRNGVDSVDDKHWRKSFEDVYTAESLQLPWYPALGNHDYRGDVKSQIKFSDMSKRWNMPDRYYTFDKFEEDVRTHVRFFVLDTNPFITDYYSDKHFKHSDLDRSSVRRQIEWLDAQLAATPEDIWTVVIGHHPIISGGHVNGDNRDLIEGVLPLLRKYRVDAYICGHVHNLQHIKPDGHTHFLVSGAGSKTRHRMGYIPELEFESNHSGFMVITATKKIMYVEVYNRHERILYQTEIHR